MCENPFRRQLVIEHLKMGFIIVLLCHLYQSICGNNLHTIYSTVYNQGSSIFLHLKKSKNKYKNTQKKYMQIVNL